MAEISLISRVRTTAGTRLKTWQKQQEDNSEGDICYLENIWGARDKPKRTVSKMNLIIVFTQFFWYF